MTAFSIGRADAALAAGDANALALELAALYPHDPDVARAREFADFALHLGRRPSANSMFASRFLDSIQDARAALDGTPPRPERSAMRIGRELDFIGDYHGPAEWTIPQFLNQLLLRRIMPSRTACVVVAMRDDGIYILEWIAYYLELGFEHIFVYTNDNTDGSEELLRLLAENGVITLIESETSGKVAPEEKAYGHSIQLLLPIRDFQWVFYVDSDEFLAPGPDGGDSITTVIEDLHARFPERMPTGICFAWRWMISDLIYAREPGLMIERFEHGKTHFMTKAMVRLDDVVSMRNSHYPVMYAGGFLVDSNFDRLPDDVSQVWTQRRSQYAGGWLNHYWPRSFEEFAIKKARARSLMLEENLYDRPFELFFEWNDYETELNYHPVPAALIGKVKRRVGELRAIEGVAALADRLDREFPALLNHYYGGGRQLRALYHRHQTAPSDL